MKVQVTHEGNGMTAVVDGSPASLIATMFDKSIITPNYGKRLTKVDSLANEIGADIHYPIVGHGIFIGFGDDAYECQTLRRAEKILRYLKRSKEKK